MFSASDQCVSDLARNHHALSLRVDRTPCLFARLNLREPEFREVLLTANITFAMLCDYYARRGLTLSSLPTYIRTATRTILMVNAFFITFRPNESEVIGTNVSHRVTLDHVVVQVFTRCQMFCSWFQMRSFSVCWLEPSACRPKS